MPSERMHRRIDNLLDEAETTADANDWQTMLARARAVLQVDPVNADAEGFVEIARSNISDDAEPAADRPAEVTTAEPAAPLPSAFVSGRYQVQALLGEGSRKVVYRAHDSRLDRDVAFALIKTAGLDHRRARPYPTRGRLPGPSRGAPTHRHGVRRG